MYAFISDSLLCHAVRDVSCSHAYNMSTVGILIAIACQVRTPHCHMQSGLHDSMHNECCTQLLSMILQVVRCFEDPDVHHVNGKVDPAEDVETINFELALADVTQIEKRLERLKKGRAKSKEEQASNEVRNVSA